MRWYGRFHCRTIPITSSKLGIWVCRCFLEASERRGAIFGDKVKTGGDVATNSLGMLFAVALDEFL